MERLLSDVRYALRGIRANPGLSAVAVLSLALGVGPTTAIFSVIDAFGFRPLPIHDPAHLLTITSRSDLGSDGEMSYPDYADIRDRARLLESVAVEGPLPVGFSHDDRPPEVVFGSTVSASYFSTLGVRAAVGRTFLPEEDRVPGSHPVVVISDRLWARAFDRDAGIVGRVVRLNTTACTIVGVMPAGFTGTQSVLAPELWAPAMAWPLFDRGGPAATLEARGRRGLTVLARARPGVTLEQAAAELEALGARLAEAWPGTNEGRRQGIEYEQAARRRVVGLVGSLSVLFVSVILLIAAANVAGLLIGRSEARRQEMAVRVALGAGRARLVRQLLTESAVLAAGAAALGLVLAFWIVRLLPALIPPMPLLMNFDFRIDLRVLLFALALALLAVPLFGLGPAILASRAEVASQLRSAAHGGGARQTFRKALVAAQVAVTLVLLVGAGMVARGLANARAVDPGFVARPMVFSTMSPSILGYDEARTREFYRQLLERLSAVPGVERATLVRHMPLNALYGGGAAMEVRLPGREPVPGEPGFFVRYNAVDDLYFDTMGTRILRGRAFGPDDRRDAPPVAIVNQQLAARLWPDGDVIGRRLRISLRGREARDVQVVGVAEDGRYLRLTEEPQPYFYLPWAQQYNSEMTVVARFSGDAGRIAEAFRREVLAVDPAMPTLGLVTLDEHLRLALVVERVTALLVGLLGALGLVLSVIGLYGVVAFLVSRRTREIGIRMALGARPGQLVAEVVGQGGRPAMAGVVIGLVMAAGVARFVSSVLYGVSPADPLVFGAATLLVVLVASGAAWLPARRAARVNPVEALRADG